VRATKFSTHARTGARRTRRLAVVALTGLAMTTSACAADSGSGSGGDTIELGMIVAETGPIAGAGKTFANGARIAAEQVNDGDLMENGKTIKLVAKEGSEDPAKSASVAAQLAADQNIIGMTCCILSTVAGAAKPIADKQQIPLMLWGATEEGLADPPYVYRTVTMPQPANEKLAQTVAEQTDIKTVAYGIMSDNAGIVSQAQAFIDGMNESGVEDLGTVETLSTMTNFTSAATDLIQKDADAIVVSGTQSNAVGLIAALHDKGYDGQVITGETVSGTGVFKSQPEALEGVPFPVYFLADQPANEAAQSFIDSYTEEYGEAPDGFAAQGYNAIYTLAMGLKAAGEDISREGLSKALEEMTELDTIYGNVTFEDGQLNATSAVQIVNYTAPDGDIAAWTPAN
jgi:branched-chain amino acid transport system substrate-binding protein